MTVNNVLPGSHDTDRIRGLDSRAAAARGIDIDAARAARQAGNPVGRDGTPAEFGAVCAFLCSAQAAFMVGQNILVDGGETLATI